MIRYFLILYRKFSILFLRPCCRFSPSCSVYAEEAIQRFGFVRGGIMALRRLIRCNQWFKGGFDPVPGL